MDSAGKSSVSSVRKSTRKTAAASGTGKSTEKTPATSAAEKNDVSSAISMNRNSSDDLTSATLEKPNGKSIASSAALETTVSSAISVNPTRSDDIPSVTLEKPNGKSIASSAAVAEPEEKSALSSESPVIPTGAVVPPANRDEVMLFRDVSLGPHQADLLFRLIHFWEARNPNTKVLIGQEMLLIDEEGTVIQGFVPSSRVGTFDLVPGSVCRLRNFYICWLL